ncbi:MAG: FG-GAP repeat domain-containing protein, partial [Pseudonocardiaceae bacterium]
MAVVLVLAVAWLAREPAYSAEEKASLAARFEFRELPLASASTARPRSIRAVAPQLRRIQGWMSSVGAAVALADADRDGLPNDVCLVDPRTDSVTVAPAPGTPRRYAPFLLEARPLPYDAATTAPMGCLPGDFDEDGRTDFLVYYWGRTPVLFLRDGAELLGAESFERRELAGSRERWYTDTVTSADVDGDGHVDLVIGNYFRDGSRLLDARASSDPAMQMQDSMSRAYNAGSDRVYLWEGPGRYREAKDALPSEVARGWTLALGASDLDGDLLPELYFAHDFGPDRLLVNRSTPGNVRFAEVSGRRTLTTAASKVLGRDSFKGMGIDFGDLNADGRLDMMVSNITSELALQESNFAWVNTGKRLEPGKAAPFTDRSAPLGLARSGWAWDVKLGDFDNDGTAEIVQAMGFLRGEVNRWPELHELTMANDELLRHPWAWPRFGAGDDLSGRQRTAFFVQGPRER